MEKEYEVKSLLAKNDFIKLKNNLYDNHKAEILENYYLETSEKFFKQNDCALKIRKTNDYIELTIKKKTLNGNNEYNNRIDTITMQAILEKKTVNLNNFESPFKERFSNLVIDTMITNRYTSKLNDSLIVLDECIFNNYTDYELEVESKSMEEAENILHAILRENNIEFIKSFPKIQRLKAYEKNEN